LRGPTDAGKAPQGYLAFVEADVDVIVALVIAVAVDLLAWGRLAHAVLAGLRRGAASLLESLVSRIVVTFRKRPATLIALPTLLWWSQADVTRTFGYFLASACAEAQILAGIVAIPLHADLTLPLAFLTAGKRVMPEI
jgi:hypothetical protein